MPRLILISNDDSIHAPGLAAMIETARPLGDLFVIAPSEPQSGMSHALTVKNPIRARKIKDEPGLTMYSCSGTPVDCIKLAMGCLSDRKPDMVLSGINHGSNSSINVIYSGTMAAAIEGTLYGLPSIGFSLCDYSHNADFSASIEYGRIICEHVSKNGLPEGIVLNVNIPKLKKHEIKGIKVCRQNSGIWTDEFDTRIDPHGVQYYWMTGRYVNREPEARDTDESALEDGYISVVPVSVDYTAYNVLHKLSIPTIRNVK